MEVLPSHESDGPPPTYEEKILKQVRAVEELSKTIARTLFSVTDNTRPMEQAEARNVREEMFDWILNLERTCHMIEEYENIEAPMGEQFGPSRQAAATPSSSQRPLSKVGVKKSAPPVLPQGIDPDPVVGPAEVVTPWDLQPGTDSAQSTKSVRSIMTVENRRLSGHVD